MGGRRRWRAGGRRRRARASPPAPARGAPRTRCSTDRFGAAQPRCMTAQRRQNGFGGSRTLGVVARADEWTGLDVAEAQTLRVRADLGELLGRPPPRDGQVLARRSEVLA